MPGKLFKKLVALVLALSCFIFAACQAPAEQGGATPGASGAPTAQGEVYAEQTLDISRFQYIQELRALEDGALAGIGSTSDGAASVFRLGEDGTITDTVALDADYGATGRRTFSLGANGDIFVHISEMPEALMAAPPAAEGEEGEDDANADGGGGDDSPSAPPGQQSKPVLKRLDADGKELSSIELQRPEAPADADPYMNTVYSFGVDTGAGLVYENTQSKINIYDLETGEHQRTVDNSSGGPNGYTVMDAGNVCEMSYGESGINLRCFNPVTGAEKWNVGIMEYPESITYSQTDKKIYVKLGRKVVGISEDGTRSTLMELSDFSVMSPFAWMSDLVVGRNGTVYCLLSEQTDRERTLAAREKALDDMEKALDDNPDATMEELSGLVNAEEVEGNRAKLIRIALTDAANVPPVQEISVSVLYEDSALSALASAFHAENPGYRVKFREMIPADELLAVQQGNGDFSEMIQRVNTEIISGHAADVLMLAGLPYESYGRKNILEDLLPYMESDPDFNMADYRENVLNAMKQDGKLFALPTSFNVSVMPSKKGAFTQSELTTAEFFDKLFALAPEEIPMRSAATLFQTLLYSNIGQFTDAEGNLTLNSPEFTGFLDNIKRADELFKSLPAIDESGGMVYFGTSDSSMPMPIVTEEQQYAMNLDDIYDYSSAAQFKQQFNKDFELRFPPSLRLPGVKGFASSSIYGINRASQNKDAAWQFLKFLISEAMQSSQYGNYGCPVNLRASEKMVKTYLRESELVLRQHAVQQRMAGGGPVREGDPYWQKYIDNQFSQEDADKLEAIISQVDTFLSYDSTALDLAGEELDPFLKGQKNAQETAQTLQSRLSMYLSEQE